MHGIEHAGPDRVDAVGEVVQERVLRQAAEPVGVDQSRVGRRGREPLRQRGVVLARVGRAGGHVDQAHDVRVGPGFRDHGAREGVASQDHRSVLQRQDAAGVRYVVGERGQRVLHGGGGQPGAL